MRNPFGRFMHRLATPTCGLVALAATACAPSPAADATAPERAKRNLLENAALLTPALQSPFFERDGSYAALVATPVCTAADTALRVSGAFYSAHAFGNYPKNLLYLSFPDGRTLAFPFMDEYTVMLQNMTVPPPTTKAGRSAPTTPAPALEINRYLLFACRRLRIVGQGRQLARLQHLVADSLLRLRPVASGQEFDRWVTMERPRDRSFFITRNRFLANRTNRNVQYYRPLKGRGGLWECTVNVSPDSLPLHWRFLRRESYAVLGD